MLFLSLEQRIDGIKKQLNCSSDIASRMLETSSARVGLIYLKSMIDNELFLNGICEPISKAEKISVTALVNDIVKTAEIEEIDESEAVGKILAGGVIIIVDGEEKIAAADIQDYPARTPTEPPTSAVIQGPREGFVEDIKTNITLIRRRFYSENLIINEMKVGKQTSTKVVVAYLKGIANKKIVSEVKSRLKKIDVDGVVDSHYILKYLEDRPDSLFKQVGNIEKPDIVAAKMLEGKVAIIVDGSPMVLTVPFVFFEELQSSNDYYNNHVYASFIRMIRLIGMMIAVIVPGVYIGLRIHHQNVIPIKFLITIINSTKGLPFTPFLEMLFIALLFQILYEVSLRLPNYLGLATSIVGALILGDTGVKAGLISPPGVIIVALAKIALYTVPEEAYQLTILQYLFLIVGGSLGMLGVIGLFLYLIIYLASIDPYGVPYLAPFAPKVLNDLQDAMFMQTTKSMKKRPKTFRSPNKTRQK